MAGRNVKDKQPTISAGSFNQQLTSYIRSGKSGIFIQSHEEVRVEAEVQSILKRLDDMGKSFEFYNWSCTQGIQNVRTGAKISDTQEPLGDNGMLQTFMKLPQQSVLLARDFHPFLGMVDHPVMVRTIRDALVVGKKSSRILITVGCNPKIPPELEKEMAVIEYKLPSKEELNIVLDGVAKSAGVELDGNRDAILDAASGLTTQEAEDAFSISFVECGDIRPDIIFREKSQTVKKNGVLEIVETKLGISDIGGLEILKDWLVKRRMAFTKKAKDYGLPVPKGILIVGLPGSGKSLSAKATASIFGVPLLKLDAGKVFGSLVGESERNIRTVIQTAEAVSPCVLMIDELEKAFAGTKSSGSTDGGTTSRVFGTFLAWMNDKTAPVFVIATANDVSSLPPELLRKGRFDEMFWVDLPNEQERTDIWRLHIRKKSRNPDKFDLSNLSNQSAEFTGAEIEAAVNDALFAAFDEDTEVKDKHLLDSIGTTVPLSRTMATQIAGLREWARGRARLASLAKSEQTGTFNRKMT